jgi:hypothetical protein
VKTIISMATDIHGMAVRGRTIYFCAEDKGLKMLNLSDKSVGDIISSRMSVVDYVADNCLHFLTFYIYYSYTSVTSTSRWYSNAIVIFNVNCIKSTGSCFIFSFLTNIQDRHWSEEYYHQHSKVCRNSCWIKALWDGFCPKKR